MFRIVVQYLTTLQLTLHIVRFFHNCWTSCFSFAEFYFSSDHYMAMLPSFRNSELEN